MDSKTKPTRGRRGTSTRTGGARRPARRTLATRRNRRTGLRLTGRNRLARAQNSLNNNRRRQKGGFVRRNRRFGFRRQRRNLRLRKVFVGNLPKFVDNRRLYGLFRREGTIVGCRIIFNRMGISRGFGEIEFNHPRDAWRVIQKWNNTTYAGNIIRVEYRKLKRNKRSDINRNTNDGYRRNNYGYNDRGYGNFGGVSRGNRGSFGGRYRGRGRGRGNRF